MACRTQFPASMGTNDCSYTILEMWLTADFAEGSSEVNTQVLEHWFHHTKVTIIPHAQYMPADCWELGQLILCLNFFLPLHSHLWEIFILPPWNVQGWVCLPTPINAIKIDSHRCAQNPYRRLFLIPSIPRVMGTLTSYKGFLLHIIICLISSPISLYRFLIFGELSMRLLDDTLHLWRKENQSLC